MLSVRRHGLLLLLLLLAARIFPTRPCIGACNGDHNWEHVPTWKAYHASKGVRLNSWEIQMIRVYVAHLHTETFAGRFTAKAPPAPRAVASEANASDSYRGKNARVNRAAIWCICIQHRHQVPLAWGYDFLPTVCSDSTTWWSRHRPKEFFNFAINIRHWVEKWKKNFVSLFLIFFYTKTLYRKHFWIFEKNFQRCYCIALCQEPRTFIFVFFKSPASRYSHEYLHCKKCLLWKLLHARYFWSID